MRRSRLCNATGRSVLVLMGGTVGAQVVTFLTLPLLSRIFSPEQFGVYTFIMALSAVIAPAAGLRLESASMLAEKTETIRALVWASIASIIIVSSLTIVALQVLQFFDEAELSRHSFLPYWVGVFVLTGALFSLLSQLALRSRQYGLVAKRSLTRAVVMAVTQLGLGYGPRVTDGLLVGGIMGQLAGLLTMVRSTREFTRLPKRGSIWPALKRYWRFPIIFTPSAVLNSVGLQAPLIFFTSVFGLSFAGQLGMAERIVAIPITLIGAAFGQVIEAEVTRMLREAKGNLSRSYVKFSGVLALAGSLVAILGLSVGGLVVPWILGAEWEIAGAVVQALAVTSGIRLVASPMSKYLIIMQKSLANTVLDVLRVLLTVTAMIVVVHSAMEFISAVWLVYSALSLTYVVTWLYGLWAVRKAV